MAKACVYSSHQCFTIGGFGEIGEYKRRLRNDDLTD